MNNLKRARVSKGLSQFELAKLSDISPSDISRVENCKLYAHPGWRRRIAEALELTELELFPEETKINEEGR